MQMFFFKLSSTFYQKERQKTKKLINNQERKSQAKKRLPTTREKFSYAKHPELYKNNLSKLLDLVLSDESIIVQQRSISLGLTQLVYYIKNSL